MPVAPPLEVERRGDAAFLQSDGALRVEAQDVAGEAWAARVGDARGLALAQFALKLGEPHLQIAHVVRVERDGFLNGAARGARVGLVERERAAVEPVGAGRHDVLRLRGRAGGGGLQHQPAEQEAERRGADIPHEHARGGPVPRQKPAGGPGERETWRRKRDGDDADQRARADRAADHRRLPAGAPVDPIHEVE